MTARSSSDDPVARPAADAPPAPELQEAHDRLKATLEALPDILFVLDRDGRIYDFHTPHPELLYVPPERFLGRTMREVLPAPAADVVDAAIADAVAHGHHHGAVYPLATSVGERWFEISISAQGEPRTPAGRLVAIVRDITDRKESEDELEDAHAWLKATLQALPNVSVHPRRTLCAVVVERLVGIFILAVHALALSEIVAASSMLFARGWWRVHFTCGSQYILIPTSSSSWTATAASSTTTPPAPR